MRLKVSSAKRQPFCIGLNVLINTAIRLPKKQQILTVMYNFMTNYDVNDNLGIYPHGHFQNVRYVK